MFHAGKLVWAGISTPQIDHHALDLVAWKYISLLVKPGDPTVSYPVPRTTSSTGRIPSTTTLAPSGCQLARSVRGGRRESGLRHQVLECLIMEAYHSQVAEYTEVHSDSRYGVEGLRLANETRQDELEPWENGAMLQDAPILRVPPLQQPSPRKGVGQAAATDVITDEPETRGDETATSLDGDFIGLGVA